MSKNKASIKIPSKQIVAIIGIILLVLMYLEIGRAHV